MEEYPEEFLNTEYPVHESRDDNTVSLWIKIKDFHWVTHKHFYNENVFGVYLDNNGKVIVELRNGNILTNTTDRR